MTDDAELLRRYVQLHSQADFTEFVRRHFSFVYHAALRRTAGRADLAQDVTQYVFTTVARQAARLSEHTVLAGWLYTTTRHATNRVLRSERRRALREQDASLMSADPSPEPAPEWNQVRQQLDGVMDQLPERDREALLLRFFHGRPFAQIGTALGLSEDAARKRVERALDNLRERLESRGITSTSLALGAALAGEAALAAPAHLAKSVASAALAQAANASLPTLGGILQLMSTKTTFGVAGTIGLAGVLVITGIGVAIHHTRVARQTEAALTLAQRQHRTESALLEKLRRDANLADTRVAEAQNALEQLRATVPTRVQGNAAAPAAKPARDQRADAEKFLATVGPARAMFTEALKGTARAYNPQFYRVANLTPAQIEEFENLLAEFRLGSLTIANGSWGMANPSQLPVDQVRQRLGDDVAQTYQDYQRMMRAYSIAADVAVTVAYTAPPMSADRVDRIALAIADNNSDFRSGKSINLANVKSAGQNWDAVITSAKATLSREQWAAAEGLFAHYRFQQANEQATQAMMVAASARPKS